MINRAGVLGTHPPSSLLRFLAFVSARCPRGGNGRVIFIVWVPASRLPFEGRRHGFSCDCGNVQRTYKCVGVLLQNVTVDIFDGVTGPVIAWIVRMISRTPEQADMGFRFSARLRPCKDPRSECLFGRMEHRQIQNDLPDAPRHSSCVRENQQAARVAPCQPIPLRSQPNPERIARSWASRPCRG